MKVKAKIKFFDLKENCMREAGDEFEVTKARYEEIQAKGGDWLDLMGTAAKDYTALTKNELIEVLEEKGIGYNPKDKKDELLKLVQGD